MLAFGRLNQQPQKNEFENFRAINKILGNLFLYLLDNGEFKKPTMNSTFIFMNLIE
jgi:hypothetical protein